MSKNPKIYCFLNCPNQACAMAEDGNLIATHFCSDELYVKEDLGITSKRKHDLYDKYYPDGYELIFIPKSVMKTHIGFIKAVERNNNIPNDIEPESA